jgi:hypothetical protein
MSNQRQNFFSKNDRPLKMLPRRQQELLCHLNCLIVKLKTMHAYFRDSSVLVPTLVIIIFSTAWIKFVFGGTVINIEPSQSTGWNSTQCCYQYCCVGSCCGYQTCCGSCCGVACCINFCCGNVQCCSATCCGYDCCAGSCCAAYCCRSPCCGTLPSYYRQTNSINDVLIGDWQENAPSNWTILSGYLRFTLHGDCAATSVTVQWNGQQIENVSVVYGSVQNVEISLDSSAISSIIRGGTNTVSLVPTQSGVCDVVGGVNFGPYPNSTALFQIELIYCGNSNDLETPKECDGGAGCNETTCLCDRTHGYTPLIPIQPYCFGCGNEIYDPPLEECDSGVGCLSNCLCNSQLKYRPTTPPSINCNGCGNGILDIGEECDSGLGCLSNCTCDRMQQYVPTTPPSLNCTKCGNAILDVGEQCDSGLGCDNVTCQCLIGWKQQGLVNCAKCGNAVIEPIEECDGGNHILLTICFFVLFCLCFLCVLLYQ